MKIDQLETLVYDILQEKVETDQGKLLLQALDPDPAGDHTEQNGHFTVKFGVDLKHTAYDDGNNITSMGAYVVYDNHGVNVSGKAKIRISIHAGQGRKQPERQTHESIINFNNQTAEEVLNQILTTFKELEGEFPYSPNYNGTLVSGIGALFAKRVCSG